MSRDAELRGLVQKMRRHIGTPELLPYADELDAILTRPEAAQVGDGAVAIWRYRFRNSETGGWHDWHYSESKPVLTSLTEGKTEIQGPFTNPQDASARDAAVRLLFSRDLYGMLMDVQNGIDSPASAGIANSLIRRIDAARDAAMSAKGKGDE